ncbi:hypothetical protein HHE02_05540 [Helicobacter heilmannii]|nr:hypothetical protein HHE02_05540 [Helicobacter heilmannii]CRF50694.1 hypothetical protein HHE06_05370 [Helicobacter heilmannii]
MVFSGDFMTYWHFDLSYGFSALSDLWAVDMWVEVLGGL